MSTVEDFVCYLVSLFPPSSFALSIHLLFSFHPPSFLPPSPFFRVTLFSCILYSPLIFHLSNLCPYESFDKLVTRILVTEIHYKSILSLYFSSMFFLLYQSCYDEEMPCLPFVLMNGGLQWIFVARRTIMKGR